MVSSKPIPCPPATATPEREQVVQPPQFSDEPAQHQARKKLLTELAGNSRNPALAEMARELLAGNVTPRGLVESGLYGEALGESTTRLDTWYGELSEDQKDEAAAQGAEVIRQLAVDADTDAPKRPVRPVEDDEIDFSERKWMVDE
jgi:hypothetical protein